GAGRRLAGGLAGLAGAGAGEDRRVGADPRGVEADDVVARQAADRLAGALHRDAVGVAREDEPGELPGRDRAGVLVRALDGRLDLGHLPRQLVLRERRRPHDLGQEVETKGQVLAEDTERHGETVAARAGLEGAAHELDRGVGPGPGAL